MKPVNVKYSNKLSEEYYGHGRVKFAFCSKIGENRTVKQLTSFAACREDVAKHFRGRATNASFKHIDIKRLRILAYLRAPHDQNPKSLPKARIRVTKQMEAAIRLLNHFEERAGWALSKLYSTDNTGKFRCRPHRYESNPVTDREPYIHIYMVVSSNKWLKSSHYISLYLLMLRIGNAGFKCKAKSHKGIMEELTKHIAKRALDAPYIRSSYKKWDIFLKNQRDLLKGRSSFKESYKLKTLSYGHSGGYNEGIEKLVNGSTYDMTLADRWYALCKKHKIHQKKNLERKRK